jgi:hypothetical protein
MTRWSFPLHWKLDARLSIPKIFTMARQLMGNSPFEIPSLDHPANKIEIRTCAISSPGGHLLDRVGAQDERPDT